MVHIAEFTADLIHHNKLNLRPERNTGIITTFHDSCNPARAMGLLEEPPRRPARRLPRIRGNAPAHHPGRNLLLRFRFRPQHRGNHGTAPARRLPPRERPPLRAGKNGVNWMSCVCAIDRATLPPLANYWAPGVTVSGLHELVANALVMKGEQPRTMNLRQEDLECPDPEPEEEAVEELAASAEEDN